MKTHNPPATTITIGTLIGLEIGEWAGFSSGRLIVKIDDGNRVEFRYGRESRGTIPKIGSLITIEHTRAMLPEILNIELISEHKSTFYEDLSESYASSFFLGRPISLMGFVLAEGIIGFILILMGLLSGTSHRMAPIIFGLCGTPHIIIGYVLWYYGGQ